MRYHNSVTEIAIWFCVGLTLAARGRALTDLDKAMLRKVLARQLEIDENAPNMVQIIERSIPEWEEALQTPPWE